MRHTPIIMAVFAILTGAGMGCASSGAGASQEAGTVSKSSPDKLNAAEIEALTSAQSAYDIILQLRPRWLQVRSTGSMTQGGIMPQTLLVYFDGNRMGTVEALKTLPAKGIKAMRFLDAARAAMELRQVGTEPIAGAIVITTQ